VAKPKPAKKQEIEVLNPKGATSSADSSSTPTAAKNTGGDDGEEEDSDLPEMTPALIGFSKIPFGNFEQSFRYIQQNRETFVPGASDALLVAAFNAESDGKPKYARQCTHQSLLLQYCEKIGGDGLGMFFSK
jgi:cell division cycle protein 37